MESVSANQQRLCDSLFWGYFSALNVQFCWGHARLKTALQPVSPSEEGTARNHTGRGLDHRADGAKFGLVVHQGTELLPLFRLFWPFVIEKCGKQSLLALRT